MYFIHAGRTRPKLSAEVDWWDRTRAEYITITITIIRYSSFHPREFYFLYSFTPPTQGVLSDDGRHAAGSTPAVFQPGTVGSALAGV